MFGVKGFAFSLTSDGRSDVWELYFEDIPFPPAARYLRH